MGVGCLNRECHVAERWVHTELCFYNLVEIRTRAFGAVCVSVYVCTRVCVRVYMHVLWRWMLLKELRWGGEKKG